jgi:hypothetical protein
MSLLAPPVIQGATKSRRLVPLRFGEYLLERRAITDEQWLDAVADHFASGGSFGATVARRGILTFDEVERWAAEFHDQLGSVEVDAGPHRGHHRA